MAGVGGGQGLGGGNCEGVGPRLVGRALVIDERGVSLGLLLGAASGLLLGPPAKHGQHLGPQHADDLGQGGRGAQGARGGGRRLAGGRAVRKALACGARGQGATTAAAGAAAAGCDDRQAGEGGHGGGKVVCFF